MIAENAYFRRHRHNSFSFVQIFLNLTYMGLKLGGQLEHEVI